MVGIYDCPILGLSEYRAVRVGETRANWTLLSFLDLEQTILELEIRNNHSTYRYMIFTK